MSEIKKVPKGRRNPVNTETKIVTSTKPIKDTPEKETRVLDGRTRQRPIKIESKTQEVIPVRSHMRQKPQKGNS
jgi:hypothetical protein